MKIPTFDEAADKCDVGFRTPLEQFIFDFEPDGEAEERAFREGLQAVVDDLIETFHE